MRALVEAHLGAAGRGASGSLPYKVDTSRPSLRTNWTRLSGRFITQNGSLVGERWGGTHPAQRGHAARLAEVLHRPREARALLLVERDDAPRARAALGALGHVAKLVQRDLSDANTHGVS